MKSGPEEIKIIPAKPQSLSATIGELAGEIDLNWDAVKDARSYVVEISKNRKDNWQQVDIVTVSKYTVSRLKSKSTYRFRIAVSDGNRQGPWSEVVTKKL